MLRRAIVGGSLAASGALVLALLTSTASAGQSATLCTTAQMGNASVTPFVIPSLAADPFLINSGIAGQLFFTTRSGNSVQSFTPATGAFAVLASTNVLQPQDVAQASDGSVWFTNPGTNTIGRVLPDGLVAQFAIPTADSNPWGITQGPDGNMWFAENNTGVSSPGQIASIDSAGKITEFNVPIAAPLEIVSGADGRLWVLGQASDLDGVGAFSMNGAFHAYPVNNWAVPTLRSLTPGPDGNVWFTNTTYPSPTVGYMTTSGLMREFPIGIPNAAPKQITAGPAGSNALWFSQANGNIGKVTTSGVVTSYPATSKTANLGGIALGSDGALWVTEAGCNVLGRMTTSPVVSAVMSTRPTTVSRGKTYTVRVKMTSKGPISVGIVGHGKRQTLLRVSGKKGVTTMKVRIPSSLLWELRGSVNLVMNASPGSSSVNAAQTAPLTVH